MKKNYLMFGTLCLLALLALSGCKKSSNGGSSKTKTVLLTQANWKFEATGLDQDKNGAVDANMLEDCEKDNIITINTNGTGIVTEGADVCDGASDTDNFAWSFTNNETGINLDVDVIGEVKILLLNETQMKLYKDLVNPITSEQMRVLFVFKH